MLNPPTRTEPAQAGAPMPGMAPGEREPKGVRRRAASPKDPGDDATVQFVEESGGDTLPNRLSNVRIRLQSLRHRAAQALLSLLPLLLLILFYLGLFFVDFLFGTDLAIFGVRDQATEQRVFARYGTLIFREQARILATYLSLGALVGVAAVLLTALWERSGAWPVLRRTARGFVPERRWTVGRRLLMTLGLGLSFHAFCLAHAVARRPQIFTEALYDRGGWRRALMLALTHQIPTPIVDGVALGALTGLILGPMLAPGGRRFLARLFGGRPSSRSAAAQQARRRGAPVRAAVAGLVVLLAVLGWLALGGADTPTASRGAPAKASPEARDVRDARSAEPRPAGAAAGQETPPSVLLIAVDSLRADRVGPWAKAIAPNIAALAERSVRFDAAHVTVPRTFPSFVTLLTGRYPHHHGIRTMFPSASERAQVGPALPGLLAQAGYRTQVFSDFCGEIFSRIDLGFRDVHVPGYDVKSIVRQRSVMVHPNLLPYVDGRLGRRLFPTLESLAEISDPELLSDRAAAFLKENARERKPFFMTVFYSSAHFPYAAPSPYYRRFTDPAYRGPFRYHKQPFLDAAMKPEDERQVRALYNGAVAAADAAIGRLLKSLRDEGLAENTIVILLADHGENLYDEAGRGMGHGDHLEGNHSLQIPLLVYDPVHRFPPHAVPGIVRDVDLAPTLLQLTSSAPAGALPVDGVSLLPLLRGERGTLGLHAFAETELWFTPTGPGFEPDDRLPYPGVTATIDIDPSDDIFLSDRWRDLVTVAKHRALQTDRWKLIYRPTRTGVHWSLYDLSKDWSESRDVVAQFPNEFGQLKGELLRFLADDPKAVVEGGYVIPR